MSVIIYHVYIMSINMTGNVSPLGQVAGASTAIGATSMVLASTGTSVFDSLMIGFFLLIIAVATTRTARLLTTRIFS